MESIDWNEKAKEIIKRELLKRGVSHVHLVEFLNAAGIEETKASIDNKIGRGTFSAAFLIQCLSAIGCTTLPIDIMKNKVINIHTHSERSQGNIPYTDEKNKTRYIDTLPFKLSDSPEMTAISLFSGAGGLDIGLEQAGFKTLACVDSEADCRETLRHNRPEWLVFDNTEKGSETRDAGNIRDIEAHEILQAVGKEKGQIDLVVGGAPCQPFSNIGKKKGREDEKNGDLFLEFVRMIKGIGPSAFIFENVAGITQKKHADVIKYMTEQFSGMDYAISHTVLNAANYGVCQRRERFFLIGIKGDKTPAFPLPTHFKDKDSWDSFTKYFNQKPLGVPAPWMTLKELLDGLPPNYKKRNDYAVMNISEKVENRMRFISQGENFKVLPMEMRPNCWKSGKHLGSDTFGRLVEALPSVTIRTAAYNPSKGRYIHPRENRGLDTVEMSAIQGFPFDWEFKSVNRSRVTLVSAGKQIGNAVPPPLAKALGLAIKIQLIHQEQASDAEPLELVAQS